MQFVSNHENTLAPPLNSNLFLLFAFRRAFEDGGDKSVERRGGNLCDSEERLKEVSRGGGRLGAEKRSREETDSFAGWLLNSFPS